MNCIFTSCIGKFIKSEDLMELFRNNFRKIFGRCPEIEQQNSWQSSIEFLKRAFNHKEFYDLIIAFEYRLPFSNERIDLLLFGKGRDGKNTIILFELKGWEKADKLQDNYVDTDIGKTVHPVYQVKNYVGKIKYCHSESEYFDIIPAILMYNSNESEINIDFKEVPVFFKNDIENLKNFISSHILSVVDKDTVEKFLNGDYKQSKKLFDAIKVHFNEIEKQSYLSLAEKGWGLSTEQLDLINEVMSDVRDKNDNTVYLVQGAPGSGKTLVAIHLLLSGLNNNYQTLLAYRNNRLINSIRDVFDSIKPGLSGPIKFYSVGPRGGYNGLAEKNFRGQGFDLVIYDEAQRMTKENIHYAMQRARISVFFYDEGQILNLEEEGLTDNFKAEAQKQNKIIKERFLKGFYRVQGGELYHKFVENLLQNPNSISKSINSWKDNYDFRVCSSIGELFSFLNEKIDNGFKVALIAAFTESPGDLKKSHSIKNLRIGYPLYSGFDIYRNFGKEIYWLMDPKNDYVPFWVNGKSNSLDKCASIYGCQGFETDFAGIIWGRDFVYRDTWQLGNNCEDNIGRPSLKDLINKKKKTEEDVKNAYRLLINRYRIFLTRGIKGIYIFCEDENTACFLKKIYNDYFSI